MKTDKQVYSIFTANPKWLFELTGLEWPGPCQWKSVVFKSLERASDGVIFPDSGEAPLTVIEFQAQFDEFIYNRIVIEMALVQEQAANRESQGIIVFFDESLDPKTEPFRRIVHAFYLDELIADLESRDPNHPLIAVFRPLLMENPETLKKNVADYYNQIGNSNLEQSAIKVLQNVFVDWLEQRFSNKGKKEIEEMLIGTLPDLRETQSGKDLIQIGRIEGKIEGKIEGLLMQLDAKFGPLDPQLQAKIQQLDSTEKIDQLLVQVIIADSIDKLDF